MWPIIPPSFPPTPQVKNHRLNICKTLCNSAHFAYFNSWQKVDRKTSVVKFGHHSRSYLEGLTKFWDFGGSPAPPYSLFSTLKTHTFDPKPLLNPNPHSSMQWASSITTAVTCFWNDTSFQRFWKLSDNTISGDTYTSCTWSLVVSTQSWGHLLSLLMKIAFIPFASASSAYYHSKYHYVWSLKSSCTWSFCNDFKGLITIDTLLCPQVLLILQIPGSSHTQSQLRRCCHIPAWHAEWCAFAILLEWMRVWVFFLTLHEALQLTCLGIWYQFSFSFWCLVTSGSTLWPCQINMRTWRWLWLSWVHGMGKTGVIWGCTQQLHLCLWCVSLTLAQNSIKLSAGGYW